MSGDRSGPRWISQHLEGEPTPRASEIVEPTPEGNVEGGGTVRVTSTRPSPGDEAVVAEPDEIAGHADDDSHVRVVDGEPELVEVEPVEPIREGAEGAPPGSPAAPLEGAPEVEPVDNGPGSEGSLDAGGDELPEGDGELPESTVTVDGREVPGEIRETEVEPEQQRGLVEGRIVARPGTPGAFEPEVHGDDRPGSIAELNDRVTVEDDTPWPEGTWIGYGSGKRAHWHGAGFATGESPGYVTA